MAATTQMTFSTLFIFRSLAALLLVLAGTLSAQAVLLPVTSGLEAHFDGQALGLAPFASVSSWTDETGICQFIHKDHSQGD